MLLQVKSSSEVLQIHQLIQDELKRQNYWTAGAIILCFFIGTLVFRYFIARSIAQAKSDITKKDIKDIETKIAEAKSDVTKKDLDEITTKVEAIKTEFIRETEKLKTSLQFENTVKTSIHNERLKAIIESYETMIVWIQSIRQGFENSLTFKDHQQIKDVQKLSLDGYYNSIKAESKVELYVRSEELRQTVFSLRVQTMEYSKQLDEYYYTLAPVLTYIEAQVQTIEASKDFKVIKNLTDELNEFNEAKFEKFQEVLKEHDPIRRSIWSLQEKYRDLCFNLISTTEVTKNG
jgi:hypothetical protein